MKKVLALIAIVMLIGCLGCTDAEIASDNLSKAADMFELNRRIVFYNGITGEYMLVIEGRCSIEHLTNRLAVICKTGDNEYKKHYLGLSDNISYFSEQLDSSKINVYHYRVIFKPKAIIPNIDLSNESFHETGKTPARELNR